MFGHFYILILLRDSGSPGPIAREVVRLSSPICQAVALASPIC